MSASSISGRFADRATASAHDIERGSVFYPRFDRDGLIAAIVADAGSGRVLMFAWMNEQALTRTIETGIAHFWSRSRSKLWRKGEDSGNQLRIREMMTDCDQDAILLRVDVTGAGVACHTGAVSCFYRRIEIASPTGAIKLSRDEPDGE